jgi:TolB protein
MARRMALALLLVLALAAGCSPTDAAQAPEARLPGPAASSGASPVASAKGWLAYQSVAADGEDGVFLVRTDGSDDHQIAAHLSGRQAHPDFARDGKRLAFDQLTSEASADQLYVAAADGSGARRVSRCAPPRCAGNSEPAWSPNGRQLAISTGSGFHPDGPPDRFGIGIFDLATRTVRPVVDHPRSVGQDHFARWSPDGHRLVFWRAHYGPGDTVRTAVFLVNANGTGLRRLTPWDMLAGDPDWSPDGSRIVFTTRPLLDFDAGQSELYTIRPNGTGLRRLTANGPNGPRATQPRWTPDGKAILYTRTTQTGQPRHIYAINADGTGDAPVLTAKSIYTHPVLQPTP